MEFKHVIEWDYLGYNNLGKSYSSPQTDWNQTLQTAINIITNNMIKEQIGFEEINLYCNEKVFNIIQTLEYFNPKLNKLNRFNIIVINIEEDNIFIDTLSLRRIPLVFLQSTTNDDKKSIKADMIYNLSEEKIIDLIKNNYGMIKIKNYE